MKTLLVILVLVFVGAVLYGRLTGRGAAAPSATRAVDEAKMYIAYGRLKDARAILERHVASNPRDMEALKLLDSIRNA